MGIFSICQRNKSKIKNKLHICRSFSYTWKVKIGTNLYVIWIISILFLFYIKTELEHIHIQYWIWIWFDPILSINVVKTPFEKHIFFAYIGYFSAFLLTHFSQKGIELWTKKNYLLSRIFDTLYLKQTKCFISSPFQLNVAICSFSLQGRS